MANLLKSSAVLPQGFSLSQEVVPLLDGTEQAESVLPLPLAPVALRKSEP